MANPKWATPERRKALIELEQKFAQYRKLNILTMQFSNPVFEAYAKPIIKDWIADDRDARAYLQRLVREALHHIPERGALRGRFNFVSRDIFHDSQPQFYIDSIGIGINFRPFAKVRLASSYCYLHIDISDSLKNLSKNKRRKLIRYRKEDIESIISTQVRKKITEFLK